VDFPGESLTLVYWEGTGVKVFALVGPSGTGKSHRATLVAREYQIDCIIDDGLLIQGSKILAGRSAKREETSLAAVRTAIISDPEHAAEIKAALRQLRPERILILGTSERMVHKITAALDLPRPEKYISIEEIATPEQISRARRIRRRHGKHVIPAPTFEVRKSFSGYLIDPLRIFHRRPRGPAALIEKSMVRPTFSSLGKFTITDAVVAAIAEHACAETAGIAEVLKTTVESREAGVIINVDVVVSYGHPLLQVLRRAQQQARDMVDHMTALNVLELNITARRISLEGRPVPAARSDRENQPGTPDVKREGGGLRGTQDSA